MMRMRPKNPHAVALGYLGGKANKGVRKPKSRANLALARQALMSGGTCECGRALSVRNRSGICRVCQRAPKKIASS